MSSINESMEDPFIRNMADGKSTDVPITKGAHLVVTVEDALPNVVLVCLKHGAKMYRGALMNSVHSSFPCGTNYGQPSLTPASTDVKTAENDAAASHKTQPNKRVEMSALVYRHTYNQTDTTGTTVTAEKSRQLVPQRKNLTRPLRDKNVRNNMRLRPRQVLCSNCKQSIHDTVVNVRTTNENNNKDQGTKENLKEVHQCSDISDESEQKKRANEDVVQSLVPRKKSHWSELLNVSKTRAPVIKISFASPHGEGRVVNIPVKPSNSTTTESESEPGTKSPHQPAKYEQYRKWRKSLRKAKLKAKSLQVVASEVPMTLRRVPHHKKSKHGKHKTKRKHKHKDTPPDPPPCHTDSAEVKNDLSPDIPILDDDDSAAINEYVGDDCWQDASNDAMFVDSDQHYEEYSIMSNTDESSLKRKICKVHAPLDDGNSKGSFESSHSHISEDVVDLISDDDESHNGSLADNLDKDCSLEGEEREPLQPLMMRIHTCSVTTCTTKEGCTFTIDDIVWGKIHGFPWWPGRICTMTVSKKDNGVVIAQLARVAWFGSSTVSHMPCAELSPFLRDYKLRYNKKKRGAYKLAIKQATLAAQSVMSDTAADEIDFSIFED